MGNAKKCAAKRVDLLSEVERLKTANPTLEQGYRDFVESFARYEKTASQLRGEKPKKRAARSLVRA